MKLTSTWLAAGLLGLTALAATAAAEDILQSQCAGCHKLTGPAPTTLKALWKRKGPDLFYAGVKYKADWVEQWLQKPTRIRPAGMFYADHIRNEGGADVVDEAMLVPHPSYSAEQARAATAALMQLKDKAELIVPGAFKPGPMSLASGEMLFDKFKGCLACHEIESGYGGLSGPEVYTAGRRLQEDYVVSFLRDPQAWDPKGYMPDRHLSDGDIQKLANYLRLLAEEGTP